MESSTSAVSASATVCGSLIGRCQQPRHDWSHHEEDPQAKHDILLLLYVDPAVPNIAALWIRHLGTEMTGEVCAKIETAAGAFDVWIPVFVEVLAEESLSSLTASTAVRGENGKLFIAGALLARSRRRIG
jgi:hypothetical protein